MKKKTEGGIRWQEHDSEVLDENLPKMIRRGNWVIKGEVKKPILYCTRVFFPHCCYFRIAALHFVEVTEGIL